MTSESVKAVYSCFQGEALACGVVTARTKVVFRSPTAMIYLFIQMSSEMWEFDAKGKWARILTSARWHDVVDS